MDLQLDGKTAVVTGASKGIGLAITEAFATEGAHVIAGARTRTDEISALESDGNVTFVPVDLSTPGGPLTLVDTAGNRDGIDILINNAGAVTPRPGGFTSVTDDDWTASLTLTFLSAARTTRAALPHMTGRGGGATIVTVSSVNAFLPDPSIIDYCAAKAALTNFCKALSKEVAPRGIRVNTVSPGPVTTALWIGDDGVAATVSRTSGITAQDVIDRTAASTETGRFTSPREVADLVAFLASPIAGNITGADFVIDGGLIKTL